MNENRISIELTAAQIKAVNDAIKALVETLQPVLIALNAEDKKNLAKLGEKSVAFVEKAIQYAESNPELVPAFINVDEMKKDYAGFNQLNAVLRPLLQITGNLDDTMTLCGSEAILQSLAFYNSAKVAAKMNVPNAGTVYEDLSQRFEAQKAKRTKPEAPKV